MEEEAKPEEEKVEEKPKEKGKPSAKIAKSEPKHIVKEMKVSPPR